MFKIGDIAIECNLIHTTQYNGEECKIEYGPYQHYFPRLQETLTAYKITPCDGRSVNTPAKCLKKKDDTVSWDEIKKVCGWKPKKIIALGHLIGGSND